jgi:hypothetical protein
VIGGTGVVNYVTKITVDGTDLMSFFGTVSGTYSHGMITFDDVITTTKLVDKVEGTSVFGMTTGEVNVGGITITVTGVDVILYGGTGTTNELVNVDGTFSIEIITTFGFVGTVTNDEVVNVDGNYVIGIITGVGIVVGT